MNSDRPIKIFTGVAGKAMGEAVCKHLGVDLGEAHVGRFRDGEVQVQILENVRDTDVFIINPTNPPAENVLEMVLLAEAAHDSSAGRITLVPTYLGYNRQDRKDRPRVATSARVIIDFLAQSGADRALLFDLHSEPTAGFFHPMMVDHLYSSSVTVPYLKTILSESSIVASPDKNAVRAEAYARRLGHEDFVVFSKSRSAPGQVKRDSIKIIGSVEGKDVLFVDDMIDSGGTMLADADAAKEAGAKKIICYATHAVFASDPKKVIEAFDNSPVDEIIITDSIPHNPELLKSKRVKVTVISMAEFVAEAIKRLHEGKSLSELIR